MQLIRGLVIIIVAFFCIGHIQPVSAKLATQEPIHHGALRGVVLFQPELRRALEQVGRKNLMNTNSFRNIDKNKAVETVDSLVSASMIFRLQGQEH